MDMIDCVGVPEFFYTTIGKTEPAGGGCVRVYCCTERDGKLVPQFTVVMPAVSLLLASRTAGLAAQNAFNEEMMLAGDPH